MCPKTEHEENIGNNDIRNPDFQVDLPLNTLDVMLQQEANVYGSECLQGLDAVIGSDHAMEWFRTMTQFCFTVVDCCELPLHCVDAAINLLDRFLFDNSDRVMSPIYSSSSSNLLITMRREILSSSAQFQLATLTCLYIASKLCSTKCLTLAQLQRLSKNTTAAQDIQSMELQILCQLQFQINPPTILSFAEHYQEELQLLWNNLDATSNDCEPQRTGDCDRSLFFHLVEQQARLATCKLYSFHVPVSSIALACVKNALEVMEAHGVAKPLSIVPEMWVNLEDKVRSHYYEDQRDIALVQEQVQSRLRSTALDAMQQWRIIYLEDEDDNATRDQVPWQPRCSVSAGVSKPSASSPTAVVSS